MIRWRPVQPGKSWAWPWGVCRIPDLLILIQQGFELVIIQSQKSGAPIYRLRRDGELAPFGSVDPATASAAHKRGYFEFTKAEADGTEPLKLLSKAERKRRRPATVASPRA